ncbi:MAG: 50S ribosomal protein L32 [Pseudomonadota bacterium]
MPVPKKRVSRTRRDKRRTHKKLSAISLSRCPQCAELMIPHRICPSCGSYKGKEILKIEAQ